MIKLNIAVKGLKFHGAGKGYVAQYQKQDDHFFHG